MNRIAGVMTEVTISDGDRLESAIKAFKRKVLRSGILKDLRKKRYYVKPSTANSGRNWIPRPVRE